MTERLTEDYFDDMQKITRHYAKSNNIDLNTGGNDFQDIIDKLAEYETAEEDGRLVVLPCKVGQCVYTNFSMSGWYMRKDKRPYIGRIVFIGLNANDPYFNIILGEGKMLQFKFSEIGKRVFLAREEAEKALMEIKKGEMTY